MSLTFAGVELVAENSLDEVDTRLLTPFLPLVDWTNREPYVDRLNAKQEYRQIRGFVSERYQPTCPQRLNVMYWPTGATRWAIFNALVTGDCLQAIVKATDNGRSPGTLMIQEMMNGQGANFAMYSLPPQPLAKIDQTVSDPKKGVQGGEPEQLFLLPLVDYRYFNQFKNTTTFDTGSSPPTWADLFALLGPKLHSTGWTAPKIDDAYAATIPDLDELKRKYFSIGEIVDAAAASVGQRVLYRPNGTAFMQSFVAAQPQWSANFSSASPVICGQTFHWLADGKSINGEACAVPAKVTVTFPKWYQHAADPNGDVYIVDQSPDDTTMPTVAGTAKLVHTTAFADFSTDSAAVSPDNATACSDLAKQIGKDYYARVSRQASIALPGFATWQPTAFDDFIEWHFASRCQGEYQCHTRVKTLDYNWGPEEMFQQFSGKKVYENPARFITTQDYVDPATTAEFLDKDGGGTGDTLLLYNSLGIFDSSETTNTKGWCWFKGDSLKWERIQEQC